MSLAREERTALADALAAVGPGRPTLCEGWDTGLLAAHVVIRDRRPDALPGVLIPAFAGHTDKLQQATVADNTYEELVEKVRSGPRISPTQLPVLGDLVNFMEFAIHTEDVLRAQSGWTPRELTASEQEGLLSRLRVLRALGSRRAGVPLTFVTPSGTRLAPRAGGDGGVTLTGEAIDLALYLSGRRGAAKVELDGPDDAVAKVRTAKLSL
ncbi:MAG TPA: TIGR03085 family metal-binding protein [Mycobacteriales bacterium]|nr:TIGR03085 family metal-binding protein [Mycobacteriales bacterium]